MIPTIDLELLKITGKTSTDLVRIVQALTEDDAEYIIWEDGQSALITNIEAIRSGLKNTRSLDKINIYRCLDTSDQWLYLFVANSQNEKHDFLIGKNPIFGWNEFNLKLIDKFHETSSKFRIIIRSPYYFASPVDNRIIKHGQDLIINKIVLESNRDGKLYEYWAADRVFEEIFLDTQDFSLIRDSLSSCYYDILEFDAFWWIIRKLIKIKRA